MFPIVSYYKENRFLLNLCKWLQRQEYKNIQFLNFGGIRYRENDKCFNSSYKFITYQIILSLTWVKRKEKKFLNLEKQNI